MGGSQLLAMTAAHRCGRQDAVGRPDVQLPEDVAGLIEWITTAVGCSNPPQGDHAALLRMVAGLPDVSSGLDDRVRRLCRMALREAHHRLAAQPGKLDALAVVADAYRQLGGEGL